MKIWNMNVKFDIMNSKRKIWEILYEVSPRQISVQLYGFIHWFLVPLQWFWTLMLIAFLCSSDFFTFQVSSNYHERCTLFLERNMPNLTRAWECLIHFAFPSWWRM